MLVILKQLMLGQQLVMTMMMGQQLWLGRKRIKWLGLMK
jgi:hypothetical protein